MDRMLQFSFLTFASVAVIGLAAILYLYATKEGTALMLAIEAGMRG